ncbi:MAG: helix-turn-helix domain-containing protein [Tumebacillaceae bacterium]
MENTKNLERLLQQQNLSLSKLSELSGVSTLALEYLVEENHLPKTHVAQKIAKVLQLPVAEIWPTLKPEAPTKR